MTKRSGIRTTEFWATVVTAAAAAVLAVQDSVPPKWALACTAVSAACYALARGLAKTPRARRRKGAAPAEKPAPWKPGPGN